MAKPPLYLESRFNAKVLFAFVTAALVITALLALTWKLAGDAAAATQRVRHTQEVLNALSITRGDMLQVELSTQNFRITGDNSYLIEREKASRSREEALGRLALLTADNAGQQVRWQQLRQVVDQRIAIARQIEVLRKTQGIEAATAYVARAPLRETRDKVYGLLDQMRDEEVSLLAAREAEQQRSRQWLLGGGLLVSGLLLALLAATSKLIQRQMQHLARSREALAEREEDLAITLQSIGDGVLATDLDGRITRLNPVAERLTGWTQAQALGKRAEEVFVIVHETTRAAVEVPIARVLQTGQQQDLANHTSLIARDGSECPIADSAAPIRDAEGQMRGAVLVFRDVTHQYQAEQQIERQKAMLEQHVQERTRQLLESEEHLRSVMAAVPALIGYVDAQQRYVYVNELYRRLFAPDRTDITGCSVSEILGPERYAVAAPMIEAALLGRPQSFDWEPKPGLWHAVNYFPKRDAQGRVLGYYLLGSDITERKRSEAAIQDLNTELAQRVQELEHVGRALRTLSAVNRTMLRASSEDELLQTMCHAIVRTGGFGMAAVWYRLDDADQTLKLMAQSGNHNSPTLLSRLPMTWADTPNGQGAAAQAVRTGQTTLISNVLEDPGYAPWLSYLDGNRSALACPLRVGQKIIGALALYDREPDTFKPDEVNLLSESADDLAFGIATLRARVEQQQIEQAMQHLTRHDVLTGLPNEAHFTEDLSMALAVAGQQSGARFAVLQTNIERIGEINDALGFSFGDQLLCEFGQRLRQCVPPDAKVARLRGDEFAILLPDSDAAAAQAQVQRLKAALAAPMPMADIEIDISARTGIALYPQHGQTPHDLYRHMDIALQLARKKGVAHLFFDLAQGVNQPQQLNLAGQLRRAIEGGDLLLYLQPKIDMRSGAVCGAEGLVRWRHAQRGLIPPMEFIGLAEQTGLITPLTDWVIETALRLNHDWSAQGGALPIAVNLSARNLRDDNLLDRLRHLRKTWPAASGLLEMEITESAVMEDAEYALGVLQSLRAEGIALYIDDFGTGYSALSYLQKLPVDYIKIDQSFVRDMCSSKDSAAIVRSTIDLVHDLGRKTVAEGVETQAHWDQLASLGCDYAQGYFIARPMPPEEFQAWRAQYEASQLMATRQG
ncbi:EAL domain-containing protein [Curvibacter gracilis]|uniref:EAL domain-containing protein n=1 Tax=Curvibacter gracilis TaxID=230310 RepID=UPI000482FD37|nr:EAL domain-containing protein [Curvibacter gracilis]